ncbi:hypothetical protein G7046_g3933 [Stylonectria norvegica]|nr:hypothetical protein G7046_g3933 [Stylonectria norvegica]
MSTPMRKVVISAYGDLSNLNIVTVELPDPTANEVQVEIFYAGFAGADVNMLKGWYPLQKSPPLTPGYCFTGRVKKNGPGASKYKPGTLVAALTVYDSDAELINIPEKYLSVVPEGLNLQHATALVLDWNTAYGMVKRAANVQKGQRVFIHGISGAVGNATMALCHLAGATVYGTASEKNHETIRAAGAIPFVYTNKDWIQSMKDIGGVHAVFDALGYESLDESWSILTSKEKSTLVCYGYNLDTLVPGGTRRSPLGSIAKLYAHNLVLFSKKSSTFYYIDRDSKHFQSDLDATFALAKEGKINVNIRSVWDFDDIKEAHKSWGKLSGVGSLLIRISPA